MSRIAKTPVTVAAGVTVTFNGQTVTVKGAKGELAFTFNSAVSFSETDGIITVKPNADDKNSWAQAGTARAVINNMIIGVSQGYEKKLTLIGVGYRAQAKGKVLDLSLGFSHPVQFSVPDGIEIETPSQTEVVIKGYDKQKVGQVAANIRSYRPPEPYKGKGIRYSDEVVVRKEAKKK